MIGKLQTVLATRNPGKATEIRELLAGLPIDIMSLDQFPGVPEVVEDGETLEENAIKKADETFRLTGVPAIADVSGLEVLGVGMTRGVWSAWYAGEHVTDAA